MPKPPYIEQVEERGDINVWVVDGTYIRGRIDEEFTNYGQHFRFPYIPENELWLDREAKGDERRFFVDHLLVERRLMKKGMPMIKPWSKLTGRNERNAVSLATSPASLNAAIACPTRAKCISDCGRNWKTG